MFWSCGTESTNIRAGYHQLARAMILPQYFALDNNSITIH